MGHHHHQQSSTLGAEPVHHQGFSVPDPFAPRQRPGADFVNALLATAVFRCWHILVFFAAWSTLITVLNNEDYNLNVSTTLLTVVGTILGFIVSYRTTSSFERYNEGRRLWSRIITASRTMSRIIWFHVPYNPPLPNETFDQTKARTLIEKKSAINLLEAFAVAVKHYLRGEDGIYYTDLYYLVKFLPAYALPAGLPSTMAVSESDSQNISVVLDPIVPNRRNGVVGQPTPGPASSQSSTLTHRGPETLRPARNKKLSYASGLLSPHTTERIVLQKQDESFLMPAYMPPKYGIFDLFPFSLLVRCLSERGKEVKGKKGARMRAQLKQHAISHNLPLELTLYLSSYVAALQTRKSFDIATANSLLNPLNQLVDSLTGLERILTTPIPFSYSIHLWVVATIYCMLLPFQIWKTFGWLTIPATVLMSFIYFGFIVAGEEIENPFGYDKNDLNLDHFTHNIIRNELRAVTSTPPPDPARWAFVPENNLLFSNSLDDRVSPLEWLDRGANAMQISLSRL